ncbi:B3 domain-containing protein Os01g0234100-like isoform X2 [Papaver somniferum]|uniref:B3 domain-containing protein Os01g0234100-like isoform X2 n=1 Tax=Papaver somniferum TaxID=3469 RepID=UPI000E700550|nr:B3 domain-containing protein Os01g0234100-like isoform X2 [Papaver somniferum]
MKVKKEIPTSLTKVVTNSFKKKSRGTRLLTMIGKPKSPILDKAEKIQTGLSPSYPSFIKLMRRSHVSGCFWMKLPSAFCNPNLPSRDIDLTLLDEEGEEYMVKCLAPKFSLSAGWRGFSLAHKLAEGDAVVFHLIGAHKFKVYIVRARGLADVDLPHFLPNNDIPAQGSVQGATERMITKKCTEKYQVSHSAVPISGEDQHTEVMDTSSAENRGKVMNAANKSSAENCTQSHPSAPFLGGDKNSNLAPPGMNATNKSPAENCAESHHSDTDNQNHNLEQPEENGSVEAIDTEVSEGARLPEPIAGIQEFTNLDSFTIIVNDMLIDPEISEDVRSKYYELCRSQKAYLHEHLMEGPNRKIVTAIISDIVNIADAVRAIKLSTPTDIFEAWEKSLKFYKHVGMNVEFLLSRVGIHLQQALAFDYNSAVIEENRLKEEMTAREAKILELRNASMSLERELTTLEGNREKHEAAFQSLVNSSW